MLIITFSFISLLMERNTFSKNPGQKFYLVVMYLLFFVTIRCA